MKKVQWMTAKQSLGNAAIEAGERVRAVAVLLHEERPLDGVSCPGRPAGAVVRRHDGVRALLGEVALPVLAVRMLALPVVPAGLSVPRVRRTDGGECKRRHEQAEQNDRSLKRHS